MKTEVYGNKASRYNFINQKLAFLVHKITRSDGKRYNFINQKLAFLVHKTTRSDEESLEVTNISRNVISSDLYKIATAFL